MLLRQRMPAGWTSKTTGSIEMKAKFSLTKSLTALRPRWRSWLKSWDFTIGM